MTKRKRAHKQWSIKHYTKDEHTNMVNPCAPDGRRFLLQNILYDVENAMSIEKILYHILRSKFSWHWPIFVHSTAHLLCCMNHLFQSLFVSVFVVYPLCVRIFSLTHKSPHMSVYLIHVANILILENHVFINTSFAPLKS